jgi:hypothetical protein
LIQIKKKFPQRRSHSRVHEHAMSSAPRLWRPHDIDDSAGLAPQNFKTKRAAQQPHRSVRTKHADVMLSGEWKSTLVNVLSSRNSKSSPRKEVQLQPWQIEPRPTATAMGGGTKSRAGGGADGAAVDAGSDNGKDAAAKKKRHGKKNPVDPILERVNAKIKKCVVSIEKMRDWLADDGDHASRKRLYDTLVDQALVNFLPSEADECREMFRSLCAPGKNRLAFTRFRQSINAAGRGLETLAADDVFCDRLFQVASKHDDYSRHYAANVGDGDYEADDDDDDEAGTTTRRERRGRGGRKKVKRPPLSLLAYVSTLAIVTRGSVREKLQLAYELFDLDGDGVLSSADVFRSLSRLMDSPIRQDMVRLYSALSAKGEKARRLRLESAHNTLHGIDDDDDDEDTRQRKEAEAAAAAAAAAIASDSALATDDYSAEKQRHAHKHEVVLTLNEFIELFRRQHVREEVKVKKKRLRRDSVVAQLKSQLGVVDQEIDNSRMGSRRRSSVSSITSGGGSGPNSNASSANNSDNDDDDDIESRTGGANLSRLLSEPPSNMVSRSSTRLSKRRISGSVLQHRENHRNQIKARIVLETLTKIFGSAGNASQLEEDEIRAILEESAQLIDQGYLDLNSRFTASKSTFLHTAVWYRLTGVIALLLKYGASPNAQNLKGNSPLHLGCEVGHKQDGCEVVGLLLGAGGDYLLMNHMKQTPLSLVQSKHVEEFIHEWHAGAKDEDMFEDKHFQPKLIDVLAYSLYFQFKDKIQTRVTLRSSVGGGKKGDDAVPTASKKLVGYRRSTSSSSSKLNSTKHAPENQTWVLKRQERDERVKKILWLNRMETEGSGKTIGASSAAATKQQAVVFDADQEELRQLRREIAAGITSATSPGSVPAGEGRRSLHLSGVAEEDSGGATAADEEVRSATARADQAVELANAALDVEERFWNSSPSPDADKLWSSSKFCPANLASSQSTSADGFLLGERVRSMDLLPSLHSSVLKSAAGGAAPAVNRADSMGARPRPPMLRVSSSNLQPTSVSQGGDAGPQIGHRSLHFTSRLVVRNFDKGSTPTSFYEHQQASAAQKRERDMSSRARTQTHSNDSPTGLTPFSSNCNSPTPAGFHFP